ncbi:MAG: exodeoxyribonuclease VII large subunit [Thermomicrobiales bacterium]
MRILTVAEATAYLKDLIEFDPVLTDVWIRGEVTTMTRSAAGHVYFNLSADEIQISCVLFRGTQRSVLAMPRVGEEVLAHGRITIYEARGQYQLMVDNVAPVGVGVLQLQFEETRRRLEAEGLFNVERKRPIPKMPATIGVVTSAQGAVWHDIQNVVTRRFPIVELILAPSIVQGPDAPAELTRSLRALDDTNRCDVIIIGRGGGSAEDLAAFNDEGLARAIFTTRAPVVSAVGHETDTCITDLVADLRAPTPSAAAELCVPDSAEIVVRLGFALTQAQSSVREVIRADREQVQRGLTATHHRSPMRSIDRARQQVDNTIGDAHRIVPRLLSAFRREVASLDTTAALLDPRSIMRRGYAIVSTRTAGEERRVTTASGAIEAAQVEIAFQDGRARATVRQEQE